MPIYIVTRGRNGIHSFSTLGSFFHDICTVLKEAGVKIYSGPRLTTSLTFGPPPAASLKTEYGDLACTIEVWRSVGSEAIVREVNGFLSRLSRTSTAPSTTSMTSEAVTRTWWWPRRALWFNPSSRAWTARAFSQMRAPGMIPSSLLCATLAFFTGPLLFYLLAEAVLLS